MSDYEFSEFSQTDLDERVVDIARVAKVVKGGRRFSFRVTVVVGDNRGSIGIGIGKANAVPDAMRKASERARGRIIGVHGVAVRFGMRNFIRTRRVSRGAGEYLLAERSVRAGIAV